MCLRTITKITARKRDKQRIASTGLICVIKGLGVQRQNISSKRLFFIKAKRYKFVFYMVMVTLLST